MAFVDGLAKLIGIDSNQVFFLICQIFAIFCGCVLRVYIPPGSSRSKQRHLFEFIIGVLVLYMGYGPYIIHLVIQAIPAYLMLVFLPLSFAQYGILIFSMAYLSAIHIYQLYTGNHSSVDISAPLMVQTQKLSSLAFNINDGVRIAAGLPVIRECHKLNAIARRPRLLQLGGYLFCFHNCMIGPSMFFADYLRFIEGREADRILDTDLQWRFNQKKDEIRVARAELLKQLKLLLLHTLLIVWAFSNFKPDHLLDDDFARKTFWQKYIYVTIACFAFRQRFYFAWTISCVANLCAGFGFSGFDDHGEPEYRFAANIHFLPIELGTSTKTILDAWNTATTRWLRECVYDRVPKRYAVWAVFVASAIWHGFHPGFYLAFVSAALITVCGRMCRRYLRPYFLGSPAMNFIYDIMTHIGAIFCLNYLGVAFLLQKTGRVLHFWRQMRFIGHLGPLALIICLPLVCGKPGNSTKLNAADRTPVQLTKNAVVTNGGTNSSRHNSAVTNNVCKLHEN